MGTRTSCAQRHASCKIHLVMEWKNWNRVDTYTYCFRFFKLHHIRRVATHTCLPQIKSPLQRTTVKRSSLMNNLISTASPPNQTSLGPQAILWQVNSVKRAQSRSDGCLSDLWTALLGNAGLKSLPELGSWHLKEPISSYAQRIPRVEARRGAIAARDAEEAARQAVSQVTQRRAPNGSQWLYQLHCWMFFC